MTPSSTSTSHRSDLLLDIYDLRKLRSYVTEYEVVKQSPFVDTHTRDIVARSYLFTSQPVALPKAHWDGQAPERDDGCYWLKASLTESFGEASKRVTILGERGNEVDHLEGPLFHFNLVPARRFGRHLGYLL